MKYKVSVILTAYNEEKNLKAAVKSVLDAVKGIMSDFEIIILDDGSRDGTNKIAKEIAQKNKRISVFTNPKNLGLGLSFRRVIPYVKSDYITVFPGDNDMSGKSLQQIIKQTGKADLIIGYMGVDNYRSFIRRFLSQSYVGILNFLFGLHLRYFNGPFICKTKSLREVRLISSGFDIYAELKIKMIKKGFSYKEIRFDHIGRKHGDSKAFTWKNIYRVVTNTVRLFMEVQIFRKDIYYQNF